MKPRIRNNSLGPHFGSIGPKRIRKPKKIFTPASDKKRTVNEVNLKKVRALKKKKNNSRLKINFSEDYSDQENDQIESTRTETVKSLKNLVHSQNESDVSCVDRINHDSGENLNSSNLEDESQAGRHNDERFSRESNQASSLDQDTSLNERRSQSHCRLLYQSDDDDYDCDVNSPGESRRNSQLDHDAIRQSLDSRKASSLDRETERGSRSPSLIQLNDNNDGDGDLETLSRPDQERRMIRNHRILKNQQNNTYDLETPVRSNQERTMSRNRPVNDVVEQPNTPRRSESFDDDYSMVEVDNDRFQMYGADYEDATMLSLGNGIFCIEDTVRKIHAQCNTPNSVVRYLMRGIFNPERVLNCTLTGRRINNQGKVRQNQPMQAINETAKDIIIKYTFSFAKKKRWPVPFIPDLNFAMSDELGKIKREQKRELERFNQ